MAGTDAKTQAVLSTNTALDCIVSPSGSEPALAGTVPPSPANAISFYANGLYKVSRFVKRVIALSSRHFLSFYGDIFRQFSSRAESPGTQKGVRRRRRRRWSGSPGSGRRVLRLARAQRRGKDHHHRDL